MNFHIQLKIEIVNQRYQRIMILNYAHIINYY